jgi:hypothetical protein
VSTCRRLADLPLEIEGGVLGAARVSVARQVNVIATMIFVFILAMMLFTVWQQRRAERMSQVQPEPELASVAA